jgi:hypothetical protein
MGLRVPIYLATARGEGQSVIDAIPGLSYVQGAGKPRVMMGVVEFLAHRVTHQEYVSGTPPNEVFTKVEHYSVPGPANQSNHPSGEWALWILYCVGQDVTKAKAKALWQTLVDRVASPQNTGPVGKYALGPWTPKQFNDTAPAAIVDKVTSSGALQHVIFGDDAVTQGQLDDGDLD